MPQPSRIIKTLGEYWKLIEALIEYRNMGSFTRHDCQQLFVRCYPSAPADADYTCIDSLENHHIIVKLPKSDRYTLDDGVLEFSRYLLNEHLLGSTEEIRALSENIQLCGNKLFAAFEEHDTHSVLEISRRLNNEIRKIHRQFNNNHQSILAIAERAKANDSNLTLEQKYKQVKEGYDEYIKPMIDMLKQDGVLMDTLRRTELGVNTLISKIEISGSGMLVGDIELMRRIVAELLEFKHQSITHLRKAAATLWPLCEQLRQNTQLSRAAANILSIARKRGTLKLFSDFSPPTLCSSTKSDIIGSHNKMLAYVAQLKHTPPEDHSIRERGENEISPIDIVTHDDVLELAQAHTPISDVMKWVMQHFGQCKAPKQISFFFLLKRHTKEIQSIERKHYEIGNYIIELTSFSASRIY